MEEDLFACFSGRGVRRVLDEEEQRGVLARPLAALDGVLAESVASLHAQKVVRAAKQHTAAHKVATSLLVCLVCYFLFYFGGK